MKKYGVGLTTTTTDLHHLGWITAFAVDRILGGASPFQFGA